MTPLGSVVIPAHDEGTTIERGLAALTREADPGEFEIVVVANGCHDETAAIARSFPYPVLVVETAVASKAAALNTGDTVAQTFPRLYLDADVEITTAAVRVLFAALGDGCHAGRPPVRYIADGASWLVRRYYDARVDLPGAVHRISGGGAFALSETGRRRFGQFPPVVADDLFVERLFGPGEWRIVDADPVAVRTPRRLSSLLKVLQRTYRGNAEQQLSPAATSSTRRDVASLARTRGKRTAAVVYAALVVGGRLRARAARPIVWERDDSGRPDALRSRVCGVDFDRLTLSGAVDAIEQLVRRREHHHVVTANVDHIVRLHRDASFRAAYAEASLILADGAPIVALSRIARRRLPGRAAGADLFAPLLARAAERNWTVFVLGGRPESIERARARLAIEHPGFVLHGHCPPVGFEHDSAALEVALTQLAGAKPDLAFLALGTPKQELFWHTHAGGLPPMLAISCGAALDFYAGVQRRAPEALQRLGFEWLFRGVTEPRLLKRYFGRDLRFFGIAARDLAGRVPPLPRDRPRYLPPR